VTVSSSVDDFRVPWADFGTFFLDRTDLDSPFLVELNRLTDSREQWNVAQWRARVLSTATWLESREVRQNGVVATFAGNTADALAVAYACWMVGACCVPLNPGDTVDRQSYILRDSGATVLIYGDSATALLQSLGPNEVELVSTADLPKTRDPVVEASGVLARPGLDLPALRVYTSGTTGQPKGVVLTARNLLTDCDALRTGLDWPDDTRVITVLPIHHVNGLVISSLLPWLAGFSIVLCDRFRSEAFWSDVREEGATVCSMVPSLLEFLLSSAGEPPSDFREILCGAGPLLTDTALEFEQRFNVPIRHLYGLSETTAVVTLTPRMESADRRRWHQAYGSPSIGPALSHVEVSVADADDNPVGEGVRGELVIRGAIVMQGYAGMDQDTAHAFRGGWFHSGDEGFWIQESEQPPFYFITGRLKELIIRGGSNIAPLEVDAVLRSHPAVDFGLAVPFENRYYGEEIAAYVVTNSPVTDEELLAHCARYLDYARQPKVIIQGDDVPFTPTGKAKRLELKSRLAPLLRSYRDHQFRRSAAVASSTVSASDPIAADGTRHTLEAN